MDKTCPGCSTTFLPKHGRQKYCTPQCGRRSRPYDREYYEKNKAACVARTRAWQKEHPERGLEAGARWREKNPEKVRERNKLRARPEYHRLVRYGLTQADYDALLAKQEGHCAMCSGDLGARPHTDHDHKTDKVRGILCAGCNHGLGYIEKPGFVDRARAYLART